MWGLATSHSRAFQAPSRYDATSPKVLAKFARPPRPSRQWGLLRKAVKSPTHALEECRGEHPDPESRGPHGRSPVVGRGTLDPRGRHLQRPDASDPDGVRHLPKWRLSVQDNRPSALDGKDAD